MIGSTSVEELKKRAQHDKIQGLIRNNKFREDVRKTIFPFSPNKKGFSHAREKAFFDKYGITLPVPSMYETLDECLEIVVREVIPTMGFEKDFTIQRIPLDVDEDARESTIREHLKKGTDYVFSTESTYVREGKFIDIRINLTKPTGEIMPAVEKDVSFFKKLIGNPTQQSRNTPIRAYDIDMWEVYDMKEKDNMRFPDIIKKLSSKDSQTPEKRKALDNAVRRAYGKAAKIIASAA